MAKIIKVKIDLTVPDAVDIDSIKAFFADTEMSINSYLEGTYEPEDGDDDYVMVDKLLVFNKYD